MTVRKFDGEWEVIEPTQGVVLHEYQPRWHEEPTDEAEADDVELGGPAVMSVGEFLLAVDCGGFIDYDGLGHPMTDGIEDTSIDVFPSTALEQLEAMPYATHIVWYNK